MGGFFRILLGGALGAVLGILFVKKQTVTKPGARVRRPRRKAGPGSSRADGAGAKQRLQPPPAPYRPLRQRRSGWPRRARDSDVRSAGSTPAVRSCCRRRPPRSPLPWWRLRPGASASRHLSAGARSAAPGRRIAPTAAAAAAVEATDSRCARAPCREVPRAGEPTGCLALAGAVAARARACGGPNKTTRQTVRPAAAAAAAEIAAADTVAGVAAADAQAPFVSAPPAPLRGQGPSVCRARADADCRVLIDSCRLRGGRRLRRYSRNPCPAPAGNHRPSSSEEEIGTRGPTARGG